VVRTRLSLVLALMVVVTAMVTGVASADTASDLAAARERVAQAQQAANAASAELVDAEGRFEDLQGRVQDLEAVIVAMQARAAQLTDFVRQRAVAAYVRGGQANFDMVFSAENPVDAARRTKLLDQANQTDNGAARKLAAIRSDLKVQQDELSKQRDEQARVKDELVVKSAAVQQQLADANQARDQLAAKLEKEQADAAAAAEAARIRAQQAASAPMAAPSQGTIIANPGGGSFQCPVVGSAYTDSYGPRGSGFHYGIDMMASMGTPLVAVKAGRVWFMPMDGAGGNEAYVDAADGNTYFYAHLSQFVGGPRQVAQGEVIGLVGSTGQSSAPHLHFEIRVGGANGQRIDPFATLQSAGC
jgi:murein DD-endopeptidase MepM/ murein hydrolase activator NlpD